MENLKTSPELLTCSPDDAPRPGSLRLLPSPAVSPASSAAARAARAAGARERRRLERDLHDGVQNELIALIAHLGFAREDPETPAALAESLSALEARAQAALESVRNIARGIYPAVLADFGLTEALLAQARRAAIDVTVGGTARRSTEEFEEAVYFACSEAIQNAAKHAGCGALCTLRLSQHGGWLSVQVADNGRGFDREHTEERGGLQNIRDRIVDLGGTVVIESDPGRGTVLTLSLPWPPAQVSVEEGEDALPGVLG